MGMRCVRHRRIGVPKGFLRHVAIQLLRHGPMSGSEIMDQVLEYTDYTPKTLTALPNEYFKMRTEARGMKNIDPNITATTVSCYFPQRASLRTHCAEPTWTRRSRSTNTEHIHKGPPELLNCFFDYHGTFITKSTPTIQNGNDGMHDEE